METATKTESRAFSLPSKKVLVVPVKRGGKWLPTDHEAHFLFKHSYISVVVPRDQRTGELTNPLTKAEQEYLESPESGLALEVGDLSVYKKGDNYWDSFRVKLDKNVLQLDLSNPMDYIRYKVLLTNKDLIAPSSSEKLNKLTYKFAIVDEDYQSEERVEKANLHKDAYMAFGKIDNSPTKMTDFLNVYNVEKPGGKSVAPNASKDFLIAEIEKIIETDIKGFLDIINGPNYSQKVTVYKALKAGALKRDGMSFQTPEGKHVGDNMTQVCEFLEDPLNSEEVIKIKARVDKANK